MVGRTVLEKKKDRRKNRNLASKKKKSRGTFFRGETAPARIFNLHTTISDILIVTFPFLTLILGYLDSVFFI